MENQEEATITLTLPVRLAVALAQVVRAADPMGIFLGKAIVPLIENEVRKLQSEVQNG